MGDDDGGGDWGGGGSSKEESAEDDGDDDDDDEEDGKKKKKKKGGLFDSMAAKLVTAAVAGVVLLSCCCCVGVGVWFGFLKAAPPYVGEFESASKIKVTIMEGDKEVEVDEFEVKLKIGGEEGTGTYIDGRTGEELKFKVKNHNKEKKTVVFELDDPKMTFWRELKSPTTFEYDGKDKTLTLTSKDGPATVLTLTRVEPARKDKDVRPPKKKKK